MHAAFRVDARLARMGEGNAARANRRKGSAVKDDARADRGSRIVAGAVAFGHFGKAIFSILKYLGVADVSFNQPKGMLYPSENPFA